jgi:Uma2 family endonuclease
MDFLGNKTYTYADYLTWQLDEYVELLRGKVFRMSPAPLRRHQEVSGKLHTELGLFFKRQPCRVYSAPFDVRFPRQQHETGDAQIITVLQPDLCVVCDQAKLDERGCVGAPDWVIEVLSAGNTPREMREKYQVYEESGVREYWIVQPDTASVLPYVLENGRFVGRAPMLKGDLVSPTIFPGLVLDLDYVFAD